MNSTVLRAAAAPLSKSRYILLKNIPSSTTPADVQRVLRRSKVQGIEDVGIHYERGHHTREAVVTLIGPNFLRDNLRALEKATFYGVPFVSRELNDEGLKTYTKYEAGSGIHAGLPAEKRGKTVLIWGLPYEMWTKSVNSLLEGFQTVGPLERIKYNPRSKPSPMARFLVTLTSESEAHRLVRKLHMAEFPLGTDETSHTVHAHVIY